MEEEILRSLRRIVRAIEMYSHTLVQQVGLTAPQLSVLRAVERLRPATPTTIARELSLSQPTVSGILDRLYSKQLLEREEESEDRRIRSYRLTAQARDILRQAPPILQESFLRQFGDLPDWQRNMILSSLQSVATLMDEGVQAGA